MPNGNNLKFALEPRSLGLTNLLVENCFTRHGQLIPKWSTSLGSSLIVSITGTDPEIGHRGAELW